MFFKLLVANGLNVSVYLPELSLYNIFLMLFQKNYWSITTCKCRTKSILAHNLDGTVMLLWRADGSWPKCRIRNGCQGVATESTMSHLFRLQQRNGNFLCCRFCDLFIEHCNFEVLLNICALFIFWFFFLIEEGVLKKMQLFTGIPLIHKMIKNNAI